jgi:glucose-6-phosphate isomerase
MNKISYVLNDAIRKAVQKTADEFSKNSVIKRIWEKDFTVWKSKKEDDVELSNRLSWLQLPSQNLNKTPDISFFAEEIAQEFEHVLLLGMGGSSLAPEVFAKTYGAKKKYPELSIVDSTHPAVIQGILDKHELEKVLFVVASKSGGTAETMSFFHTFFENISNQNPLPGLQFIALTDPASGLEQLAKVKGFRKIFSTPPEVGGRYSVLTEFGLVPAGLIGMDVERFLKFAEQMEKACQDENPLENPGVMPGIVVGEAAKLGFDKLTFFASPSIASFPQWVEQLIAESTGKEGTGILPVADEPFTSAEFYGKDRVFVFLRLEDDDNEELDAIKKTLLEKQHNIITVELGDIYTLAQEFYRWEMATAVAGAVLQINPFDQPNVQLAKTLANEGLAAYKQSGSFPEEKPAFIEDGLEIYCDTKKIVLQKALADFFTSQLEGKFVSLLGFIPYDEKTDKLLSQIRTKIKDKYHCTTTTGYGPRFLHSTGQLHKGGKNNGLFMQITGTIDKDIEVPGQGYTFGVLVTAQAHGDLQALRNKHRKVMRIHCTNGINNGLEYLLSKI